MQASNVATYIAHGDVALSVLMTTASTLGAIVMTPLLTKTLAGTLVPVDAKVTPKHPHPQYQCSGSAVAVCTPLLGGTSGLYTSRTVLPASWSWDCSGLFNLKFWLCESAAAPSSFTISLISVWYYAQSRW